MKWGCAHRQLEMKEGVGNEIEIGNAHIGAAVGLRAQRHELLWHGGYIMSTGRRRRAGRGHRALECET